MKQPHKQEIAFSNPYIYYYASLIRKLYGFVLRRDKAPDERYIGHLGQPPTRKDLPTNITSTEKPKPRTQGQPLTGEIVLFRYRKRLLLGYCQHVLSRAVSEIAVVSEDRRRLRFHHTNLIYLTGITIDDHPEFLHPYAKSVRKLSTDITLHDIWELAQESQTTLAFDDIAELYWNTIDATRWLALYLHLDHACPYFISQGPNPFRPANQEEINARNRVHRQERQHSEERLEFVHWMLDPDDTHRETLTPNQQKWLECLQQFALWGQEADKATDARDLLADICPGKKDLQRAAAACLVNKGIWQEHENRDLLRADIPLTFSAETQHKADDISISLKGRKKFRQPLFLLQTTAHPDVALSFRQPLIGGPEFGIHIPDFSAFVPPNTALDQTASDRLMAIRLPDQAIPLLPTNLIQKTQFATNTPHPTLSLLWKMDRKGRLKSFTIQPTIATVQTRLTPEDTDLAHHTPSHSAHRAIQFLAQLTDRLSAHRTPRDPDLSKTPPTWAHRITSELHTLASVAVAHWCLEQNLPAIYETRDPIPDLDTLQQIDHPIVRRHEIQRVTPSVHYDIQPAHHHGLGIAQCCPITRPTQRYTDLLMHHQITHALLHNTHRYTTDHLNTLRYRLQETHRLAEGLIYRRTRELYLRSFEHQTDREHRAVVLHIRRHGVLVECLDTPFKTIVYPSYPVSVGEELTLRLTGIDLWSSQAHFTVLPQNEMQLRP